jgi:hypothetical protein
MSSADTVDYTSHQHKAHITDSRVILYPWHLWYGKTALIFTSVAKTGQAVFRCGLAGVNYFFRWRQLFLPVLSLHHWSTITQSDAKGARSSGSAIF